MQKADLKPCPFCGSTDLTEEATGAAEIRGYTYQTCWIECNECGTCGPAIELSDVKTASPDYQEVRDAWNKRCEPT